MAINRALPAEKFIDRQFVTVASFLEAEQAAANGCNDLCLPSNDPPLGFPRRQIGNRKRAPIGSDYVTHARSKLLFGHSTHNTVQDPDFRIAERNEF